MQFPSPLSVLIVAIEFRVHTMSFCVCMRREVEPFQQGYPLALRPSGPWLLSSDVHAHAFELQRQPAATS